jgi:hypothetical protein
MIWFLKTDYPVLTDLAYISLNFNCYDHSGNKIVALIGCIDIGGSLLDFLERCAK